MYLQRGKKEDWSNINLKKFQSRNEYKGSVGFMINSTIKTVTRKEKKK